MWVFHFLSKWIYARRYIRSACHWYGVFATAQYHFSLIMLTCRAAVRLTALPTASSRYSSSAGLMHRRGAADGQTAAIGGGKARLAQTPGADFTRSVIIGSIQSTLVPASAGAPLHCHLTFNSATGWHNRITSESCRSFRTKMDGQSPLVLRLIASSVRVADRAGLIVRNIMSGGNLGIVDKVTLSVELY
jgi:hypothetical protein